MLRSGLENRGLSFLQFLLPSAHLDRQHALILGNRIDGFDAR